MTFTLRGQGRFRDAADVFFLAGCYAAPWIGYWIIRWRL